MESLVGRGRQVVGEPALLGMVAPIYRQFPTAEQPVEGGLVHEVIHCWRASAASQGERFVIHWKELVPSSAKVELGFSAARSKRRLLPIHLSLARFEEI